MALIGLAILGRLGNLAHEVARLHGDGRVIARRRVDLVVGDFEAGDRDRFLGRWACAPVPLLIWTVAATPATPTPPSGSSIVFGCFSGRGPAFFLGLGLEQGLTVRHGDLVIVWMDFGKGQEAVAVAPVIDEGCLQRGFYARNFGEVDIAPKLLLAC